MFSTLRKLGAAVAVITAVMSILAAAAPASAAEPNYRQTIANYQFGAGAEYTNISGNVTCPTGTKAVTTGATSGDRDSMLSAGSTTFDGTGGFHAAWGHDNHTLQLRATCVGSSRLAGSFPTTLTVRDHRDGWRSYVKSVTCPTGTVAYGGGGNQLTGGVPSGHLYTFGSMPSGEQLDVRRGRYPRHFAAGSRCALPAQGKARKDRHGLGHRDEARRHWAAADLRQRTLPERVLRVRRRRLVPPDRLDHPRVARLPHDVGHRRRRTGLVRGGDHLVPGHPADQCGALHHPARLSDPHSQAARRTRVEPPLGVVRQSTERVVAPADLSARAIRVLSELLTPLRTVISTRPSSNSAEIWLLSIPSGRLMLRRNSP